MNGPNTKAYDVEYRGEAGFNVYLDQPIGKAVIVDPNGNFRAGWPVPNKFTESLLMESYGEVGVDDYARFMRDDVAGKIDAVEYTQRCFDFNKRRVNLPAEDAKEIILRAHGDAEDYVSDPQLRKEDPEWIDEAELKKRVSQSLRNLQELGYNWESASGRQVAEQPGSTDRQGGDSSTPLAISRLRGISVENKYRELSLMETLGDESGIGDYMRLMKDYPGRPHAGSIVRTELLRPRKKASDYTFRGSRSNHATRLWRRR